MINNKIFIFLLTLTFILLVYNIYYEISLRIISMRNEKIYLENKNENTETPKIVMQTYWDKNLIPKKVYDGIKKYCPGYKHIVYDDEDCVKFLRENYGKEITERFLSLKLGAHKADLFRYCWLYKVGGVYMDIKIVLLKNIEEIFKESNKLYTVVSIKSGYKKILLDLINSGVVFQGIISTPPNNPVFKRLIDRIMMTNDYKLSLNYLEFTMQFYDEIKNIREDKAEFFQEICGGEKNKDIETKDRYGYKCSIYNKDERIFLTRYPDYPWKLKL